MSRYRPYPAYRDFGAEPVGKVPEHWEVARAARLGPLRKANGGSKEDNVEDGVPCVRYGDLYTTHDQWIRHTTTFIAEERASDYTPIQHGDVLFAASGETFEEIGKSAVNLLPDDACCGGDVIVLRPSPVADPLFLGYALDCSASRAQKAQMGKGFTVKHIYADQLRNLLVALPPVAEQRIIAAALDRETARIDALIAKKTEFIDLLGKKRQTLITRAVTKGLNTKAKQRDSGVEWVGDVPEHWRSMKFSRVARVTEGLVDPRLARYRNMVLLAPNHIESSTGKILALETAAAQDAESGKYTCKQGAVVYSKIRPALAKVAIAPCDCLCSADMYPMDCSERVDADWLFFLMLSPPFTAWAVLESDRVAMPKINRESLADLRVFLPPIEEQAELVRWVRVELKRVDVLAERTKHSIDLLKQRRSALITAAVTGQIDLRESA